MLCWLSFCLLLTWLCIEIIFQQVLSTVHYLPNHSYRVMEACLNFHQVVWWLHNLEICIWHKYIKVDVCMLLCQKSVVFRMRGLCLSLSSFSVVCTWADTTSYHIAASCNWPGFFTGREEAFCVPVSSLESVIWESWAMYQIYLGSWHEIRLGNVY